MWFLEWSKNRRRRKGVRFIPGAHIWFPVFVLAEFGYLKESNIPDCEEYFDKLSYEPNTNLVLNPRGSNKS